MKNTADSAGTKWKKSSTVTKACIIGTATGLAAPLAIIPVLGMVGFTSAGVAAGSFAASIQTATTVSGSIFALCQSAGAVGAVATTTSVGVGLAAGATAGGVTAAVCKKKRRSQNNDEKEQAEDEKDEDAQREGERVFKVRRRKILKVRKRRVFNVRRRKMLKMLAMNRLIP